MRQRESIGRYGIAVLLAAASLGGGRVAADAAAPPGATLHVLVVGDRWDGLVGNDVEQNIASLQSVFQGNIDPGHLRFSEITRGEFTRDGVLRRVASLPLGADDALVIPVMAHGAHDPTAGPYLKLPGDQTLLIQELRAAVQSHPNRLSVLLLDICKRVEPRPQPKAAPAAMAPFGEKYLYRTLFFESRGYIELHAAEVGQSALCLRAYEVRDPTTGDFLRFSHRGSLFTQAFVSFLYENAYERHMSWEFATADVKRRVSQSFRDEWPDGFHEPPVVFGALPRTQPDQTVRLNSRVPAWATYSTRVGLTVEEMAAPPGNGPAGVRVTRVHPTSPASNLAYPFEPGDTITALGDRPMVNPADFAHAADEAGGRVRIQGRQVRDGRPYSIVLNLPPAQGIDRSPPPPVERPPFFGTSLAPDPRGGLQVVSLVPGTTAAAYRYVPGTRILRIDGRAMRTREDFGEALRVAGQGMRVEGLDRSGRPFDEVVSLRERLGIFWANDGANPPGVRIVRLWPGFPAQRAGLSPGDKILGADGRRIADGSDIDRLAAEASRGLTLDVLRSNGRAVETITVDLAGSRQSPP